MSKKKYKKGIESITKEIDVHKNIKLEKALEEGNIELAGYYEKEIKRLEEQLREKEEELSGLKEAYEKLVAELQTEIFHKDVTLHQVKEQLTVTIIDRVLFPSGQATLTPEGLQVMEKVGAVLAKVKDRRIQIEGHTDNVPIGPTLQQIFPSNWELSAARAAEVAKYLITQAKIPPERLIAAGQADTAPVAPNTTEEGRRQNRRIEIILLPPEEIGRRAAG
jgi:chemotaxis protein MotB